MTRTARGIAVVPNWLEDELAMGRVSSETSGQCAELEVKRVDKVTRIGSDTSSQRVGNVPT